jgi:photosystem II stability/assembly factor-like uncharacterized protein
LALTVIFGCKTQRGLGIDEEELKNLRKPLVDRINPQGIIYNNMGFILDVYGEFVDNDEYVLYLNRHKLGIGKPNYWRYRIAWEIPNSILMGILNAAGNGETQVEVRISSIVNYDISDHFDYYDDYVSVVKILQIKRNATDFSSPGRLFDEWNFSSNPILRIDNNGYLYLAWLELMEEKRQAMFCFSQDGGLTWSQVLNISRSANTVEYMDMDVDEAGHFYMVWSEGVLEENVYFSRSLDAGITWYNPLKISTDNMPDSIPVIEVDAQGKIIIFWRGSLPPDIPYPLQKAMLLTSTDLGDNWDIRLFKESDDNLGYPAVKSSHDGTIYFVCNGNEGIDLYFSEDDGLSWQVRKSGVDANFWKSWYTSLVIDMDNTLFLTWSTEDYLGHNPNSWTHFLRATDGGSSWSDVQYIDDVCSTAGGNTALLVNNGYVNMVPNSYSSLFLLRSTDGGQTWSFPEFIPGTEKSRAPDAVMDKSGKIYMVFVADYNSNDGGALKLISWQN